jgi:hypothetical protein
LLYFTPLKPLQPRTIFAPARHRPIIETIYANLGVEVAWAGSGPSTGQPTSLSVSHLPHDQFAEIRILNVGADFEEVLRHELREQTVHHGCETVYLDLPLSQPETASAAESAEEQGFSFLGVGPCFAEDGDMVRMAFIADPLSSDHIHVISQFGQELVAYALDEMKRVANR